MTPRYLVVAATAADAAHVPADLSLVITGMGKTAAAVATARALAAYDDLAGLTVLNIGSVGALRPGSTGQQRRSPPAGAPPRGLQVDDPRRHDL